MKRGLCPAYFKIEKNMISIPSIDIQKKQVEAFENGLNPSTLLSARSGKWVTPTGNDVRVVLAMSGLTGSAAGSLLGVASRTIRKWVGDDQNIKFAAWCLLCERAGLGMIWIED
tara:strand:- start:338 stop:679 length:342 start_codon:yes stop_codon:yes gene_type:complete